VELFEEILRKYRFRGEARHERSFRIRLHHAGAWFMIGLRRIAKQIQKECRGGMAAIPQAGFEQNRRTHFTCAMPARLLLENEKSVSGPCPRAYLLNDGL
jgi:hypothetical protein